MLKKKIRVDEEAMRRTATAAAADGNVSTDEWTIEWMCVYAGAGASIALRACVQYVLLYKLLACLLLLTL